MAVRCSEPASDVMTGASAQKLRWNIFSGSRAAGVPDETVDDVAEMEDECRAVCIVRAATIHGDLIRDPELIEVFARIGGPRIAECVKDDLSRILDLLDELSSMTAVGVLELKQVVVVAPRFFEAHDILLQKILDFVVDRIVARMLGLEPGRIWRRHLLTEVRLMKDRLC